MNEFNFNEDIKPKKSKLPFGIIIVTVICVATVSSIFIYKNAFENKEVNNQTKETENKKDNEEKESQTPEKAEDENKEYVIDATYKKEVSKESYQVRDKTIRIQDLVFPYLNVDTETAKSVNEEIEKVYDEYLVLFELYSEVGEDEISSKYSYTLNDNIISILLEVNYAAGGGSPSTSYYTFNYDIKEDKKIALNDLTTKYNINMESLNKKVTDKISTSITDTFEINNPEEELPELPEYIEQNKEYYESSLKTDTTLIYIDKDNTLNVLVFIEHPCGGSGFYYETITVTK